MPLPYDATITTAPVSEYAHLKAPLRAKWISCITCREVPTETVYRVHVPAQMQGDKRSFAYGTSCCSESCALQWLETLTFHFYTLEELEGSQLLPTQETKPGWIHCFRKEGFYPDGTAKSGKWLIFLSPESIDRYWVKIKQAVEQGQLGSEAKVSTAGSRNSQGTHVICVYTYDYRDKDDAMRIRQVLRDLGIRRPITYKADEDTTKLRYGSNYTPIYRS